MSKNWDLQPIGNMGNVSEFSVKWWLNLKLDPSDPVNFERPAYLANILATNLRENFSNKQQTKPLSNSWPTEIM